MLNSSDKGADGWHVDCRRNCPELQRSRHSHAALTGHEDWPTHFNTKFGDSLIGVEGPIREYYKVTPFETMARCAT